MVAYPNKKRPRGDFLTCSFRVDPKMEGAYVNSRPRTAGAGFVLLLGVVRAASEHGKDAA